MLVARLREAAVGSRGRGAAGLGAGAQALERDAGRRAARVDGVRASRAGGAPRAPISRPSGAACPVCTQRDGAGRRRGRGGGGGGAVAVVPGRALRRQRRPRRARPHRRAAALLSLSDSVKADGVERQLARRRRIGGAASGRLTTIGIDVGGTKIRGVRLDDRRRRPGSPTPVGPRGAGRVAGGRRRDGLPIRHRHRGRPRHARASSDATARSASGPTSPASSTSRRRPSCEAASRPAGDRRQRRHVRDAGPSTSGGRPGLRRRDPRHARHRHRRAASWPVARCSAARNGFAGRARPHGGRPRRAAVPVRPAGLLGAVRVGQRARPPGPRGRRRGTGDASWSWPAATPRRAGRARHRGRRG